MSSPLRAGFRAFMAAAYVAASSGAIIWAVDLAIVSSLESLFEALALLPARWAAAMHAWDHYSALVLAVPMTVAIGWAVFSRAYAFERLEGDQ